MLSVSWTGCDWTRGCSCGGSIVIWLAGKAQCWGCSTLIWGDNEMWNSYQVRKVWQKKESWKDIGMFPIWDREVFKWLLKKQYLWVSNYFNSNKNKQFDESQAVTYNLLKVQEESQVQRAIIGFSFTSRWKKNWCKIFTFRSHLKTALKDTSND